MKFTADKAALLDTLHLAAKVAERRTTMPILSNALLRVKGGILTIAATDLQMTTRATLPVTGASNGDITAGAVDLLRIVDGMQQDAVSIARMDNHYVEIKSGKQTYKLVGLSGNDFPKLPDAPEEMATIDGAEFARVLGAVVHAVSVEFTLKLHLCGVHFTGTDQAMRAVTTDGHRLASEIGKGGYGLHAPITIPTAAVKAIIPMVTGCEDVAIGVDKGHLFVRAGASMLAAKVIEAQFPPFEQVIPKSHDTRVVVNALALAGAVKRVAAMGDKAKAMGVKLTFGEAVEVFAEGIEKGVGSEEIESTIKGPEVTIGASATYVIDALSKVDGDAAVELSGALDPIVIRPVSGGDSLHVVMPMRL